MANGRIGVPATPWCSRGRRLATLGDRWIDPVVKEFKTSYLNVLSSQVTCRRAKKRPRLALDLLLQGSAPIRALPPFARFHRAVFQGQTSRCGISNFKI